MNPCMGPFSDERPVVVLVLVLVLVHSHGSQLNMEKIPTLTLAEISPLSSQLLKGLTRQSPASKRALKS